MSLARSLRRVAFYAKGAIRDIIPYRFYEARRDRIFSSIDLESDTPGIAERLNYYIKFNDLRRLDDAPRISHMDLESSYYYYDLKQYAKYFGSAAKLDYRFGDITDVPLQPAIVKSRPIGDHNSNSVVMKLNKLRHYTWPADRIAFRDKRKSAVWRGILGTSPVRRALIEQFWRHRTHDIGHTCEKGGDIAPKAYLDVQQQFQHRYILSIEGNDVATNLKWIMASRSLCIMPRPRYETWFMEGRLVPDTHYVEVRPDFADLEEKIAHYDRNEDEALAIIANANRYAAQFRDKKSEDLLSLLILQKYLERTGQRAPEPFSEALFR